MTALVDLGATSDGAITALRFHAKGDIRLEQVSKVPCGQDEVRLKIAYCGICGSDIHELQAGPIFPPAHGSSHPFTGVKLPVTMGHEFSGTIIEAGASVVNLKVGQHVAVNPALDHRHYKGTDLCTGCKAERYNICSGTATYGLSAPGGGFSDEIVVKAGNCFVVPNNVSLKAAALTEPLAVAHHCITLAGFTKGQSALICGAGPIGLALLLILRVMGASHIIVTEVAERRSEQAKTFGADAVINPLRSGLNGANPALSAVQALQGNGVDVAFDATGLQSTLDLCLAGTKAGGTIFNVAIHEKPLSLNLNDISKAEKKLLGGICYTATDFEAVLKLMEEGALKAEQMVTSVVPLASIVEGGFNELINNRENHVKILIQP